MKKSIKKFLLKYSTIAQTLFSLLVSIFAGLYICKIEAQIQQGKTFLEGMQAAGFTLELFIAIILLIGSLLFEYYIVKSPMHNIETDRENIINGLLASLTEALFVSYGSDIDVSSVVQMCDYKTGMREVVYQYNTDPNAMKAQKMGVFFGDVGESCIKNKQPMLVKTFTIDDWKNQDSSYQTIVPEGLRMIFAKPIYLEQEVVAVIEIDIFESTDESRSTVGGTKPGYITNTLTVATLEHDLRERAVQKMLGSWANSISLLLD